MKSDSPKKGEESIEETLKILEYNQRVIHNELRKIVEQLSRMDGSVSSYDIDLGGIAGIRND